MFYLLLFLLSSTNGDLSGFKDADCVVRMEAAHECKSDARAHYDEALEEDDGKPDFQERKFCNWMTDSYETCTSFIVGNCFSEEEVNFWVDNDLMNQLEGLEDLYKNWDSQKCPPFRKMLERKALKESSGQVESDECDEALQTFQDCRQRALTEFEEATDDGEPDFAERMQCNVETAWLDCPNKLLGVCKTQTEIERIQYWELINDDFEFENWKRDNCPVVKEVVTRWNMLREKIKSLSVDVGGDVGSIEGFEMEEKDLAKACVKISTCMECEQKPGCGWCSSPEKDYVARCNTKKLISEICPADGIEKKYDAEPRIIKAHTDLSAWASPSFIQLRPKHVEIGLNVGEPKILNFTYMFMQSGTVFTHNLPDHIGLKIFSTCGKWEEEKEVDGCHRILNGKVIKFRAEFQLKYCPKDASMWKGNYLIFNTQGDYGDDPDFHVDLKLFCACSCDKHTPDLVCRNDKKKYLEINPCANKNSCSECLRDESCNWCSGSKYSHPDGSPLPRCNGDDFFASTLCPSETKADPERALTNFEDCTTCNHTCSGGICNEDKKDIIESNICVSQLTCGTCLKESGCAWCPDEGNAHCNLVSHFNEQVCNAEIYKNETGCDCERRCHQSYEKYSFSCNGGTKACGVCKDCPLGTKGESCQCSTINAEDQTQLRELPHVVMGRKDTLLVNASGTIPNKIGFHHTIAPTMISPAILRCNATYCINPNSHSCYYKFNDAYDVAGVFSIFGIYGDKRLLPGSELVFKITYCPLHFGTGQNEARYETGFGFASPLSKDTGYSPAPKAKNSLKYFYYEQADYYADDMIIWQDGGSGYIRKVMLQRFPKFKDEVPKITGVDSKWERLDILADAEIKLVVTETEVVWSWNGFRNPKNPNLTEARLNFDIREKDYYPFFVLTGCNTDGQFSAVEIVSSKSPN